MCSELIFFFQLKEAKGVESCPHTVHQYLSYNFNLDSRGIFFLLSLTLHSREEQQTNVQVIACEIITECTKLS